ncbi:MAG: hypothetical protein JWP78_150 [Mucilaginibacter sp.]|nr:hypothetical protein [Mucilaginibacter sp.]
MAKVTSGSAAVNHPIEKNPFESNFHHWGTILCFWVCDLVKLGFNPLFTIGVPAQ